MATKTVADIMSDEVEFVPSGTSLAGAAKRMRDLDCGFLPVSDPGRQKLLGVVTDRDIVIRGVAEERDPLMTPVEEVLSNRVLYCYQTDDIAVAATSMHDQQIYRLVVLDNENDKKLCGVVSLNDIVRHDAEGLAARVAHGIAA